MEENDIFAHDVPGELSADVATAIPTTNFIVLRQLPVFENRLREVKDSVEKRVEDAVSRAFASGTIEDAKKIRAELNRENREQNAFFKAVIEKAMEPITQCKQTYKECSADPYKRGDARLKAYIDSGEKAIKQLCEAGLREYFAELCEVHHIDFLRYSQAGVKVDLTSAKAKTPTKLRNQLEQFVVNVACDVRLISKMEDSEEIMVEFKKTLSVAKSVAAVQERHRQIEAEKAAAEQRRADQERENQAEERVQAFAPPIVQEPPKMVRATFAVTDTIDRLRFLKQLLEANGFKYE